MYWGFTTYQPLRVILWSLPEKGRRQTEEILGRWNRYTTPSPHPAIPAPPIIDTSRCYLGIYILQTHLSSRREIGQLTLGCLWVPGRTITVNISPSSYYKLGRSRCSASFQQQFDMGIPTKYGRQPPQAPDNSWMAWNGNIQMTTERTNEEELEIRSWNGLKPGPSCSELTMSLGNVSLKLWSLNMAYPLILLMKKCA